MKIAIVGFGSIGKRHYENLRGMGHDCVPLDVGSKLVFDVDCAFVCTPTQFHVDNAIEYMRRGIPIFIEKPLTYNLVQLDTIEKAIDKYPVISMVGCNIRFHPSIQKAKTIADGKKVIYARAETGYYLPFWRKGDYKQSYSASEYGGIIIDAIHEPDYLYWLFGEIKDIKLVCDKVSDLEIKREDIAEIGMVFNCGVTASVHCDYLMKNYHRKLDLYMPHEIITYKIMPTNIMYKKEVEYFIDSLKQNKQPMNGIKEACYLLRKVLQSGGYNSGEIIKHKTATKNI